MSAWEKVAAPNWLFPPHAAIGDSFEWIGAVLNRLAAAEGGQVQTERHRAQGYSNAAVLAMLDVAKMNAAKGEKRCFLRQRRAGMIAIAAAMPVALLLWLGIAYFMPPLAGMDTLGDRMVFALKCCCIAVLFCLVAGVEAVAHERLSSPAFDPLSGFETRRLRVNQLYLQNTLEQILVP
jgi:hypothetical protein